MKMNILKKTVAACSVAAFMAVGCVSVAQAHTSRLSDTYGDPNLSIPAGVNTPIYVKAGTYNVFCKGAVDAKGVVTMLSPSDATGMNPGGWKSGGQLACGTSGGNVASNPVMISGVIDTDDSQGLTIGAASIYCVPAGLDKTKNKFTMGDWVEATSKGSTAMPSWTCEEHTPS